MVEARYLETRAPEDLQSLYNRLIPAGRTLLSPLLGKLGIGFTVERRREIVHDAVTRLLEMYLKNPGQHSMPLASRLHLELVFQLHNPKQVRTDQTPELPETAGYYHQVNGEGRTPVSDYLLKIAADKRVKGKHIVYDLYRNKYYKRAILKIETYTPRQWIYEHAVELRTIFLMTRVAK
jgi:hypothetical protein